ncbi:MAG: hypothetical protein NVSMB44_29570 [Ktedonobacteraceae bacterium]
MRDWSRVCGMGRGVDNRPGREWESSKSDKQKCEPHYSNKRKDGHFNSLYKYAYALHL